MLLALIGLFLLRRFALTLLLIFAGVLFGVFLHGCAALLRRRLRLPAALALGMVVVMRAAGMTTFCWLAGPQTVQQVQTLA